MNKKLLLTIAFLSLFIVSNKPRNFSNFTLTGFGFTGTYHGFESVPFEKNSALYSTAKKWGITIKGYGCTITNQQINPIFRSNREAETNLSLKYGSDWNEKFLKEVDFAY